MKDKTLMKRIIATALSLIMVIGLLPFSAFAADNDATVESNLGDFFDPTQKGNAPEQFNTAGTPYGDDLFNLAPQNELMKIITGRNNDRTNNHGYITDGLQLGTTLIDDNSNAGNLIAQVEDPVESWSYMQAVAFDPAGTGRDTHVAYIGYVPDSKTIRVGIYDAVNGTSGGTRWVADASWIAEADGHSLMQYSAYNFMSITAGDYDGDGKETIVTFGSGNDTTATLTEWYFSTSSNFLYQQATSNSLLHKEYILDGKGDTTNGSEKLGGDLATGDFDGDGLDDLAVVSYPGIEEKYEGDDMLEDIAPYLAVALGRGSGTYIVNQTSHNLAPYDQSTSGAFEIATNQDGTFSHFVFPASPSVAAGNMDSDPEDELVIGGYAFKLSGNRVMQTLDGASGMIDGVHLFSYNISQSNISRFSSVDTTVNKWTESISPTLNNYGNRPFSCPQVGLAFVKTNGASAPEDLFVNGSFMKYSQQKGTWDVQYQDGYFAENQKGVAKWKAQIGFITNVSVGVFDDNLLGREQVAYTIWIKDGESSNLIGTTENADDYSVFTGISGGWLYADSGNAYGTVTNYNSSGVDDQSNGYKDHNSQAFHNTNFDCGDAKNLFFVAVDIDNDGVLAKYADKDYAYSDPTVITVLQASPYYEAFGYPDKCETSYTFETSFIVGQTTSSSTSFSIGVSVEVEAPVVKSSIRSGYSGGWEESFTSEFETTYSTTFTATKDNVVVLQRTPVILYKYLVQKSDGTWSSATDNDNGSFVTISVPCEPVYALVTVEEYNAFVTSDAYKNAIKTNSLSAITMDELIGNAGDPADYFDVWPEGATNLSAGTYSASSGTGSVTSAYSTSGSDTIEQSSTQGFYFGQTVSVGYSSPIGVGAWAGVEFETEGSTTQGSFTTTVSSTAVSGTVGNLGESGLPAEMLNKYVFTWQFGSWKMNLGSNANIYAYGYRVMGAQLVDQVKNLKVTDGDGDAESAVLTWDAVNDATKYTVYAYANGQYTEIATTTDNTYTYVIPSDTRQYDFTFAVTFTRDGADSIYSDLVTYYRKSYGMSAYEIALQEGFEGTVQEWLESLVGADGEDGVGVKNLSYNNAGELLATLTDGTIINLGVIAGEDGSNGLSPYIGENGNWWIGEADTGVKATGADGEDGADGITPQLRINTETNEWEVSLDNGATWSSTGVKATGEKGDKGDTGNGIANVALDEANSDETKSVYIITMTDGSTYSFTVNHGADGEDGAAGATGDPGADGITPQLRINSETNEWEVSLDNGATWSSTGVKATGEKGDKGDTGNGIANVALDEANSDETKSVYIITMTDGSTYSFTVNHGADGEDGAAGATGDPGANGITPQLRINSETNEWEVSLDNGATWSSTGVAATGAKGDKGDKGDTGEKGDKGDAGVGVKSAALDQDGNLIITLTDGTVQNLGKIIGADGAAGTDGKDGADGKDGVGVKSAALDQNGNLIITLTDDTVLNLGTVLGTNGKNGKDGKDGADGKNGTNGKDGKNGVDGKDGVDGEDGTDGKDGATPFIGENGNWWIGETDTGVRATPIDVSDISLDDNGNLIYTMSDGSTINAGSIAENEAIQAMAGVSASGVTAEDIAFVKTFATIAVILSALSLLWNVAGLIMYATKKKKAMIP